MSVLSFLYSQLFVTPPVPTYDFTGQTIIITGANRGIGLEAARHLLRLNARRVVLAVRSTKRGEDAAAELKKSTTGHPGIIQVEELDMASHSSVKAFAARMNKLDRLDGVLLNAGMYTHEFYLADGFLESHLVVNVINTFFLSFLLLPILRASAERSHNARARISFVSSDRHVMYGLPEWKEENPFEVLSDPERARMDERLVKTPVVFARVISMLIKDTSYMITKLMVILLTREMAVHVKPSDIIVNTFTPGYCESGLIDNIKGTTRVALNLLKKATARTAEVGGRTLVAAIVPWPESHGRYLNDSKIDDLALSSFVRSDEGAKAQKKLWKDLMDLLEQREPLVQSSISPGQQGPDARA
ncbi:short-chain dehydrogenase/reductase [Penicillium coprophilum]|uniref:short-chain dehydrogenase/reductase n=1 Tax=Penicillium coprophilum TaxID=36646 RepID=UPI002383A50B|nr:short-chain dehydrogenase/reductase [Penicillium coprophilum]KAJ5150453.1 short-chain dehydrogenase/reductase [Penicillium coprophilum]